MGSVRQLSEAESSALVARYGVPVVTALGHLWRRARYLRQRGLA